MTREAKRLHAADQHGSGLLGPVVGHRALAIRATSRGSKGSRALAASLLAVSLIALFATAAPALAADPSAKMGAISEVSYTSAQVAGTITSDGSGAGGVAYGFQYSTDPSDPSKWITGFSSAFGESLPGAFTDTPVGPKLITGLKGDTEYFVRLVVNYGFFFGGGTEVPSPEPYPSFTTLAADPPTIPGPVAASSILSTSAMATAKVVRPAESDDVNCHFEVISEAQFLENEGNGDPGFTGATERDCAENPIKAAETEQDVTAQLGCTDPLLEDPEGKCLKPATTYRLRLIAENAASGGPVVKVGSTFTTEPKVTAPTVVTTDDASEVKYNSAKLTGKVQRPAGVDPALNVSCHFEVISEAQFLANEGNGDPGFNGASPVGCVENTITSEGEATVSANAGLLPDTTYHLRLVAENAGGTDVKIAANTFTTPEADLPTVTIDPVAGGTYTTAHVSGTVERDDPGHVLINPYIEVSTDGGATWPNGFSGEIPGSFTGSGPLVVEKDFTGLQPNTTYTFRIKANYDGINPDQAEANGEMAFSPEPNPSITTEPLAPPTAGDLAVSDVTANTAHFSGTVDPHAPAGPLNEAGKKAFAIHWEFICTPACKDANGNTIEGTVQGEEGAQTVAGDAKRLEANTPFEVSLVISGEGGGETVGPIPFSTPMVKPTVRAARGDSDGKGGYTLQGVVNPNKSNTSCKFEWGPNSADYAFTVPCSPAPEDKGQPVTVEAHLTGLNPGVVYHFNLIATNDAGTAESGDQEFIPTLDPPQNCSNEQQRTESSSLALPECRAYEQVSNPTKSGNDAGLVDYTDGGTVLYSSGAGNIANSGQGTVSGANRYTTIRSSSGWETIANLNGPTGSPYSGPEPPFTMFDPCCFSADLRSSLWYLNPGDPTFEANDTDTPMRPYLRNPDGSFTLIGITNAVGPPYGGLQTRPFTFGEEAYSDDLTHVVYTDGQELWRGPWGDEGVYEYVGTGNDLPRRVDLDNLGNPVSTCKREVTGDRGPSTGDSTLGQSTARVEAISGDGRVIFITAFGGTNAAGGQCTGQPANELWARVNGTTSFEASASQCNRTPPAEPCNAPAPAYFIGAAKDGSRVFFTTTQQLVDGDTDQTNDLYACDIPSGSPTPIGTANSCASLRRISGSSSKPEVEQLDVPLDSGRVTHFIAAPISANGSTAYFTAKGVLADNEDSLGEKAVAGDHNLYVWRTDAAHPAGRVAFVARLDSADTGAARAQTTADGRYLVFTTASQLVPTDTDKADDVYRYDAETGTVDRVSTSVLGVGVGGNSEDSTVAIGGVTYHHPHANVSDDGQKIVFTTQEALSPLDGNEESDVYLWSAGRVSLVTTGSVGGGVVGRVPGGVGVVSAAVSGSGKDIYFNTRQALSPDDDDRSVDVYNARVGGGFIFASTGSCSGEACQPPPANPPALSSPPTVQPLADPGNVKPKTCRKGKVVRGGKCVKKPRKKHHKEPHRKSGHSRGGSK